MIVGSKRFFRRTDLITPGAEEGAVNLVGLPKNPMVMGDKIFMRAEGILRDEGNEVMLAGLTMVVGSKWRLVPRSSSSGTWTWPMILNISSR
ncbi:hypothetical protein A2U01_0062942 [Trifolium medium]|uniref:Uncharacterized protein n=1 Tax=Trifolium medium TaxID=97028 RepID=A0A392RYK8_9FABA|nr:hypothetical protein [Trifolium medium]